MKWFSCRTRLWALTPSSEISSGKRAISSLLVCTSGITKCLEAKYQLNLSVTTSYGSISRTAQSLSDVPPHPTASVITLNFPITHDDIIKNFKEHIQANPARPNKKRVAIIDSIVSNPGVLLPWKEMVAICKDEGIWSVIDAAHSIGQEVGINLTKAAPDFWISVCLFDDDRWLNSLLSLQIELPQMALCQTSLCCSLCA
jgi:hypothetical protein